MLPIEAALPRPEHPWLATFEADPHCEFDRLMRGIAEIPPYERAEPGSVLWVLFGALVPEDPLRAMLDEAVGDWLERRRAEGPEQRLGYGIRRYVGQVTDALSFVARLDLRATARRLRAAHGAYLAWTTDLILTSAHDPRVRLWQALAETQEDDELDWLWYRICDGAGRRFYPDHYLSTGLLGLRRLPRSEREVHRAMLGGLVRWARHLREGKADERRFREEWLALEWLYPRAPSYWQELAGPLLEERANREKPFAAWWRAELKLDRSRASAARHEGRFWKGEVEELLSRFVREGLAAVRPGIQVLMDDLVEVAESSGESHYLVRSAHNIGERVLNADAALALRLARLAVKWEPMNARGWMLWAKALTGLARFGLAEAVYWESLRRFPDDVVCRNALAEFLAGQPGREAEAEALYRDTIHRFRENVVCRVALAEFLGARPGREAEAEALFQEAIEIDPRAADARTAYGFWLVDRQSFDDAGLQVGPLQRLDRNAAAALSRAIENGRRGRPARERTEPAAPAAVAGIEAAMDEAGDLRLDGNGRIGRADFRLGPALEDEHIAADARDRLRREAVADLEAVAGRGHGSDSYANLVLARHHVLGEAEYRARAAALPGSYPIQLDLARRSADRVEFARLAKDFDAFRPLSRLAMAATLSDQADEAWTASAKWLDRPVKEDDADEDENAVVRYAHRELRKLLPAEMRAAGIPAEDLRTLVARHAPEVSTMLSNAMFMAVDIDPPEAAVAS